MMYIVVGVLHAISLRCVFEPFARRIVVDFHLARMQYRATHVAGRTAEKDHFFSQVYVSVPVFITKLEAFKGDNLFAYDRLFSV